LAGFFGFAINGVMKKLGGGAVMIVSVAMDIPTSFAVVGLCYLAAALAGPIRWR
jgi:hypothetical protein